MKDSQKNAALTLWVTYLALAIVIAVSIGLAWMLNVNSIHRMLLPVERTAIIAGYYCSLPMILLALWEVVGLLKNIQRRAVFVAENV